MQPQEFLAAVLPSEGHGYYCAAELVRRKHDFTPTIAGLKVAADKIAARKLGVYYAMATYKTEGSRKVDNVAYLKCIFVDIDCGVDAGYPTKKEAVKALQAFLEATGLIELGMPWLVDSGGGVHVYWPLNCEITVDEWRPVAEAFKATAARLGFKIDMTVTSDAARVLRVPGTFNYKRETPREVVLKQTGATFDIEDMAARLDKPSAMVLTKPPTRALATTAMSPVMQALTQNSVTYFKDIMVKTANGNGCAQLAYYVDNAQQDGMEPLWRGLLSWAQKCEDGGKAARYLSGLHPYTEERTQAKLAEIKGPYACAKMDSVNPGVCSTCPNYGKFTNALSLGRRSTTTIEPKEIHIDSNTVDESGEPVPDQPYSGLVRPVPPRGFSYGTQGGVFCTVSNVDKKGNVTKEEKMLLPYDFFLTDVMYEDEYVSRFVAVRGKEVVHVVVPNSAMGNKDAVIKQLAAQNIICPFGHGYDAYLHGYVRAMAAEASITNKSLRVPPRYGWQPDDSFAICDQVLQRGNKGYTFVSAADNHRNLIAVTQPRGTLEGWQRYVKLIQDKGLFGILGCMMVSFGSPLMRWAGAGTPAMMFHACHNDSGHGKSLALQLAASVYGNPATYPIKPSTSGNTMMQRAGLLGNLPFLVDEVTVAARNSVNKDFLPSLIYNYSQGGHKLKGSGTGNSEVANDLFWSALGLVTSNVPAMEQMLTARDTTSFGELMRTLEWHPTEKLTWTDAERVLKPLLEENFGLAGLKYLRWIIENPETAREVRQRCVDKFRKLINAADQERFWAEGCGTNIAGAVLCGPKYANIFEFDTKAIALEYVRWVEDARHLIASNVRNGVDLLNSFTREFHGQFVKFAKESGPTATWSDGRAIGRDSAKGKIAGRVEVDITPGWTDYYIDLATFKRYVAERNYSYSELFKELQKTMVVSDHHRKDLLANTGGPSLRVTCVKISRERKDDEEKFD